MNYVGLISSSQLRIRRSEGNTLVDHKKIKNTKGIKRHKKRKRENKTNRRHDIAHLVKGCRPLWRTRGVLIPSPCVKRTPEPFTLKVLDHTFPIFLTFSSNKRWWRLRAFSSHGRRTREPRIALPPKGRLRHHPLVIIQYLTSQFQN